MKMYYENCQIKNSFFGVINAPICFPILRHFSSFLSIGKSKPFMLLINVTLKDSFLTCVCHAINIYLNGDTLLVLFSIIVNCNLLFFITNNYIL